MLFKSWLGLFVFLVSLGLFLLWPISTWADGFRNPFQDAAAMAQGTAFIAQANNPSAIHYNPAGMTQLPGFQQAFGVAFISPNTTFKIPTGDRVENDLGGPVGLPPSGQLFITGSLASLKLTDSDRVWLGLGLKSLFGFANKYPKGGPFATTITRSQLPFVDIKPTMAVKITGMVSIGLGADIFTFASFIGEGHAETQFIGVGNIPGTQPGDLIEINGSGTTAGLNASILLTPWRNATRKPLVNIGFIWRSQAVLPLDGELLANGRHVADVSSSIKFPESYEGGLAVWPIRNTQYEWKIETDVHYVRWRTIRNFDLHLSNGVSLYQPQKWKNAVTVAIGTEFTWLKLAALPDWDIALRTGYIRSPSPIPDNNFNPAFPDSDNHTFSIGTGFFCQGNGQLLGFIQCDDKEEGWFPTTAIGLDLAFQAILWDTRKVTNHPNPTINGTYRTRTYGEQLTFRVNF